MDELNALKLEHEKSKEAPKEKVPAPTVVKPAYTSPAPSRKVVEDIAISQIFSEDNYISLHVLERRLLINSYVGGHLPTADDEK